MLVIAHQALLRCLYAYFAPGREISLEEVPFLKIPLHTLIELNHGRTGKVEEVSGTVGPFNVLQGSVHRSVQCSLPFPSSLSPPHPLLRCAIS